MELNMAKPIRSFKHLLGKLQGISDPQLEAHFILYEGYVKKISEIDEKLRPIYKIKSSQIIPSQCSD